MDKIISIRRNNQILSLFAKIQQFQVSSNRTDIINAAINNALEQRKNNSLNWRSIASAKIPSIHIDHDLPSFIQLRVDENKYIEIVNQIKNDFELQKNSPASFVVKLLLINYLLFLNCNGIEIVRKKKDDVDKIKIEKLSNFKQLNSDDKLDALYELLLEIKYDA